MSEHNNPGPGSSSGALIVLSLLGLLVFGVASIGYAAFLLTTLF